MEGMTDQSAVSLVPLAKVVAAAAAAGNRLGLPRPGYDASQRAYVVSATGPAPPFASRRPPTIRSSISAS